MAYDNFQQLLNDIQAKFLDNNTRLITEPVMRQVQTDIATFFDKRIIDYYSIQQADDADYTVGFVLDTSSGLNDITDSVLLLPSATEIRQVIFPPNVNAGNHLLIFVKDSPTPPIDSGRYYWQASINLVDQYGTTTDLKPGHNFLIWTVDSGDPILLYMGWDSRMNVITVSEERSLESITVAYLDETFSMLTLGQQIIFDNLSDAPSNVAVVFKTAAGWAMNTSANKIL